MLPYFSKNVGRSLVGNSNVTLENQAWLQAHNYVLNNSDHIEPFLKKHFEYLSSIGHPRQEIRRLHHDTFHQWFRIHVGGLLRSGEHVEDEVIALAEGPLMVAKKYSSYAINGYVFHTKSYDEGRPGQSSRVALVAQNSSYSGVSQIKAYYGIITEIIELSYHRKGNIVLFKCVWVDNRVQDKWMKTDKFGVTSVNMAHMINTGEKPMDDPFILSSQACQVYYVPDPQNKDWCAVRISPPRDCYDIDEVTDQHLDYLLQEPVIPINLNANFKVPGDDILVRNDTTESNVKREKR